MRKAFKGISSFFARYYLFALIPFLGGLFLSLLLIVYVSLMKFPIDLDIYQPKEQTQMFDRGGELICPLFAEKREIIPLDEMNEYVINSTLAIEDPFFFSHKGLRFKPLIRAIVFMGKKGGGSTITQQLAKNMTNRAEKKLVRKIKEALFALKIEMEYSKSQILELYLNLINYGHGNFGVSLASLSYFNKKPSDLTLGEAALLAAVPQRPSYFYPVRHLNRALKRQKVILEKMLEHGFITRREFDDAVKEKIEIVEGKREHDFAAYFRDYVVTYLVNKYGYAVTFNGGLKVYTTLRNDVQTSLEDALKDSGRQGGVITLDPLTGGILGMVGGRDYNESKFNRTTQAPRQCGSAFKVFLYTTYFKHRIGTLADLWVDGPIHFPELEKKQSEDPEQEDLIGWAPKNYSEFLGPVTVYDAIIRSINIVALKVLLRIGVNELLKTAREMGIKSYLAPIASLPLGSNEVTPLEIAGAFSVLANGGFRIEPYFIERIEDQKGRVLEQADISRKKIIDDQTVFLMNWVLKMAVAHGTGMAARVKGYPVAGKTGTTNSYTDAWFIGYTPNYVTAVYIGNDDPQKSLGKDMTGGAVAAPVWNRAMAPILKKEVPVDFRMPSGIKFLEIDRDTGLLASPYSERRIFLPFIEGTEVTKKSPRKENDILWDSLKDVKWLE